MAVLMVAVAAIAPMAQAETGGLGQFLPFGFSGTSSSSFGGGPVAVDPADGNSVFYADLTLDASENVLAQIRKLSSSGTLQGTVDPPGVSYGTTGQLFIDSLAVDPSLHRLYALVDDFPRAHSTKILVFSTDPDGSGRLVAPSDATAVADGVSDGVLVDFREAAVSAKGVDWASGIAVDPGTHEVVLLGVDDMEAAAPKAVLQYIDQAGVPGTRLDDLGPDFDPDAPLLSMAGSSLTSYAGTVQPLGLAIGPDGAVYVASGSPDEGERKDLRVYRFTRHTDDPALVATDPAVNSPFPKPGLAGSRFANLEGVGSPIALSSDGGTVYLVEGDNGFSRIRGFDAATGIPTVFYGTGETACRIRQIGSLGIAAGAGGFLAAGTGVVNFIEGAPSLYTFGENGSGCDRKVEPKFTIDGQSGGTITLDKGAEVELDATGSELKGLGAPVEQLDWDLTGSGEFTTVDTDGNLKGTYRLLKAGTYQVGLKVETLAGVPPVTAPVFQTVKVVPPTPTASFTASTKSPASGEAVNFNASGSVDPAGSPTAEPTHDLATYKWDFGDGTTQSTTTPTVGHAYTNTTAAPVARTVKLTVVSHDNVESAPVQQTVTVAAAPVDNPPSGGGDNPPSNGGGGGNTNPPSTTPGPAATPKPKPNPLTCKKGQVKKKGKCVKKPARHKKHKKH